MNWFGHCGLGFHAGEWLASAIVILASFAFCESEKEYWRMHKG